MTCAHSPVTLKSLLDCSSHLTHCHNDTFTVLKKLTFITDAIFPGFFFVCLYYLSILNSQKPWIQRAACSGGLRGYSETTQEDHVSDLCDSLHTPDVEYKEW